jgi:dockerin type I repeat protein
VTRRILLVAVLASCGAPPQRAPAPPRSTTPAPVRRLARCGGDGRIEAGGRPFSDDLSGLLLDGEVLWTHTDARRPRTVLYAIHFTNPGRPIRSREFREPATDPEDVAPSPDGTSYFVADVGDNSGPAACYRYAHRDPDTCVLVGTVPDVADEAACTSSAGRLWLRKTIADQRPAPYRVLHVSHGSTRPSAVLEWASYPHDERGRCGGMRCGTMALSTAENADDPRVGRFDAEALFARRERNGDGSVGTSVYVVTKAGVPLETLAAIQRNDPCRFAGDGLALVFRVASVDRMRGRVDLSNELDLVAVLDLREPGPADMSSALGVRVTGAAFEGNDLVLVTRGRSLRWHVPADVERLDQRFFDEHPPCLAAHPPVTDAPKIEAVALDAVRADGVRGWYLMSESGDWIFEGVEGTFRVEERWSYEGAAFVRGDLDGDGRLDASDVPRLTSLIETGTGACLDAADVNDDGNVDVADARALESAIAAAESRRCVRDETADSLGCVSYAGVCAP